MLLGFPSSAAIYTSTELTDIANYYALYVQDDFRVSGRLTLNLGLRWEHEPGLSEVNNGMLMNFDGTATNPLAANVTGISPKGEVVYAGNGRTTVGNPTFSKLGPRVGFAYKLDEKTVIRGGYGIFWAPQFAIGSPIATVGSCRWRNKGRMRAGFVRGFKYAQHSAKRAKAGDENCIARPDRHQRKV